MTEVVGRHEWDAVNENWLANRQIGWRSREGLENAGRVKFQPQGPNQTLVTVYITCNPPGGSLGDLGEMTGAGKRFEREREQDLQNFAQMVAEAPPGALDPNASNYIFHSGSAAARGETSDAQDEAMST